MTRTRRRRIGQALGVVVVAGVLAASVFIVRQSSRQAELRLPPAPADARPEGAASVSPLPGSGAGLVLPKKLGSLRFAVMGDTGRGDRAQYDTANEMARWREQFDFSFVLMLGDNIYAAGTPENYAARFERPYKALIDAGVTFYAALGNHDPPDQWNYPLFHMDGNRYYSFTKKDGALPIATDQVQFFALDTVTLDSEQLVWLQRELGRSKADWKICFYHHPLYTSGRYRTSAFRLRTRLEPIFLQYGVDVGLSGHEHFYERIVMRGGVQYFTSGAGGALRRNDMSPSPWTAAGFDADTHFMLMEISGDILYFQAISRTGQTIDSGGLKRGADRKPPATIGR
ncbi:MAG TPA: metallophosphoesterase [Vicinamibacterales bacterium]|nr:metallophosphoesterase [Vicinamibacterales bacterium]